MSGTENNRLAALIEAELARPADAAAYKVVEAIRAEHGDAVRAVLFYGSCRRAAQPDGVLDFYILVDDYHSYHRNLFRSLINRLLPPDVSFLRAGDAAAGHDFQQGGGAPGIAAKITVISCDQFARRVRPDAIDTTLWARFTQPSSLLYAADESAKCQVLAALMMAVRTACGWAVKCGPAASSSALFWGQLFSMTYGAELRVERGNRPQLIYDNDVDYYDGIFNALELDLPRTRINPAPGAWAFRRMAGKVLSVLRLCKAAFTFKGGVDYLLWKIERHSGAALTLRPWQYRHPILAAPQLLYRLLRQGVLR